MIQLSRFMLIFLLSTVIYVYPNSATWDDGCGINYLLVFRVATFSLLNAFVRQDVAQTYIGITRYIISIDRWSNVYCLESVLLPVGLQFSLL